MLATAIVVFREVLEASLIIGIVMAASVGIRRRGLWVGAGGAAGLAGAGVVAAFAAAIGTAFSGSGQELLNAAVLGLAVIMLGWHNIWMATHARELASAARALGRDVLAGTRPMAALAVIAGVAVLREGSETVLFLYGIAATSSDWAAMLAGGLVGLAAGVSVGVLLYLGLLRIPVHRLFAVTGLLVLFLAAGLAAQAAGFLLQADMVPALGDQIWNSSALLSETSLPGRILHTLIGYTARPAGVQVMAYVVTLLVIGAGMWAVARPRRRNLLAGVVLLVGGLAGARTTHAGLFVHMPQVEFGESAHNGLITFDTKG